MKFAVGDDVIVEFDGVEHRGEVEKLAAGGWVHCRIVIDPSLQYSSSPPPPALDPQTVVCVRDTHVRHAEVSA